MLSFEEEMSLSDLLVARSRVLDLLVGDDGRQRDPDVSDHHTIAAGNAAARTLVEAYEPFLRRLARTVYERRATTGVELEDLVNEAFAAAMKCTRRFDLRNEGSDYSGRRFNTYCKMAVFKALNQQVSSMGTLIKAPPAVITTSWAWAAASAELTETLGRTPTDDEVARATDIDPASVIRNIPHRNSFVNLDDPESENMPGGEETIRIGRETQLSWEVLEQLLREVFREDLVGVMLCSLGRGREYPRTPAEVAAETGYTVRAVTAMLNMMNDCLVHPHYRMLFARLATPNESVIQLTA